MSVYKEKKEFAKTLLDIALKYNELLEYLFGSIDYDINFHDNQGNKIVPIDIIMESIYDKYKENPELNIDNLLFQAFEKGFSTIKNGKVLLDLLSEIEFQMRSEKNGTAPFKLNNMNLLKVLSQNIKNNKELYMMPRENGQRNFIEQFEHHDTILEDYGHKIL